MSTNPETDVAFADLSQTSPDQFEAQLNTEFDVDLNYCGLELDGSPVRRDVYPEGASLKLELVEVTRKAPASPHLRQEPFCMLFRGSHDIPLYGDVHVLIHESLGKMTLLLNAVNASPGIAPETHPEGRFYECVIN